jgi:hypothetical protein
MYSAVLSGDRVEHDEGNERLQALQAAARGRVGEHGVEQSLDCCPLLILLGQCVLAPARLTFTAPASLLADREHLEGPRAGLVKLVIYGRIPLLGYVAVISPLRPVEPLLGSAIPSSRCLDSPDTGQLLGVRHEVYGLHYTVGDVENEG